MIFRPPVRAGTPYLTNLDSVVENLNKNVTDLKDNKVWTGAGYEAWASHIKKISAQMEVAIKAARKGTGPGGAGIVQTLATASSSLSNSQDQMPIPAEALPDVLAARNAHGEIQIGLFELKVKHNFIYRRCSNGGRLDQQPNR